MKATHSSTESRTDDRPTPAPTVRQRNDRSTRPRVDRGQAELLGAILLFGLLIAVVVLIQVAAVPTWNQQLEFEHSQEVSEDLQQLGQVMSDVAADGGDRSITIDMGVRYPTRPFLFNPAPATGNLQTTEAETLTISNGDLVGVDNYWSASQQFDTRTIRYEASYNEYRNDPVTRYEYGLLVDEFPNGAERPTRTLPVVNGTNINLVLVDGELAEATAGAVTVPVEGVSAPSNGVKLQRADANGDIVITLPTAYGVSVWQEQLSDEPTVESVSSAGPGLVNVTLNGTRTYNLRMAKVGVGSGYSQEPAEYITTKGDPTKVVARNTSNELVVEVRDQFNNPVPGQEVEFAITGGSGATLSDTTATSGENGEASVFVETLDDSTVTVEATINGGGAAREQTEFTVEVVEGGIRSVGDGDGLGPEDAVSTINPETIELTDVTLPGGDEETTLTFDNNLDKRYRVGALRISYYFNGQQDPPSSLVYTGDNTTIEIGDTFENGVVSGPTLSKDGDSGQVKTLTFDLSGIQGNTWNTDFFVLSIRFVDDGGGTVTYSYFVAFQ